MVQVCWSRYSAKRYSPALILRTHCTACFRCLPPLTQLIRMIAVQQNPFKGEFCFFQTWTLVFSKFYFLTHPEKPGASPSRPQLFISASSISGLVGAVHILPAIRFNRLQTPSFYHVYYDPEVLLYFLPGRFGPSTQLHHSRTASLLLQQIHHALQF